MRRPASLLTPVRRRLRLPCLVDRGSDHRGTVFVAGTARSGTTWVSEVINHSNDFRSIFEPFNERKVPLVRRFGNRRYLRPENDDPELLRIAARILSGGIRDPWTGRFNRRLIADRRLVKAIRANLLLKWLHAHFPGMPIVLVCRHPCAVARSYAKHGWRGSVESFLGQEELMQDFLSEHRAEIRNARTRFERAAFIWCVETLVPLSQFRPGEIHVVFYEHLVLEPGPTIERLFGFLGQDCDDSVLERTARPSLTARADSAISHGRDPIRSWQTELPRPQAERAREIVARFGLDRLYSEDALPDVEGLRSLMRSD